MNRQTGMTINQVAVMQLRSLGFPIRQIRLALAKLNGRTHGRMASEIGVSRMSVGHHLNGERRNPDVQQAISHILQVPANVLFEDVRTKVA